MCASWGPIWSLRVVYLIFPFSKLLVYCLGSYILLRSGISQRIQIKYFEVLLLSSIFSIVIPQTVSLPKSPLFGPLLVFLTCMWVLSLLLLLDASGGRTETINGDFPSWSLDHMGSLVGEQDSPLFRYPPSFHCHHYHRVESSGVGLAGSFQQSWERKKETLGNFPHFLCLLEATLPNPKNKRRLISLEMLFLHTWYTGTPTDSNTRKYARKKE